MQKWLHWKWVPLSARCCREQKSVFANLRKIPASPQLRDKVFEIASRLTVETTRITTSLCKRFGHRAPHAPVTENVEDHAIRR